MFRSALTIAALCLISASAEATPKTSIAKDGEDCSKDPRYRVGGAAIGDCLQELSDALDIRIAAEVSAGVERYPVEADRADYMQAQADWLTYRKRICDLVERSPGNTPSWVNSAACRLELGRQRMDVLRYTREYGTPRPRVE